MTDGVYQAIPPTWTKKPQHPDSSRRVPEYVKKATDEFFNGKKSDIYRIQKKFLPDGVFGSRHKQQIKEMNEYHAQVLWYNQYID